MSDTPLPPAITSIHPPPTAPDPERDPEGFAQWAASPAGVEFFRVAAMRLMEGRINAEQEERARTTEAAAKREIEACNEEAA